MPPADEIMSLLKTFDPIGDTTGQSWADVGLDICREAFARFTEVDWAEFDVRKAQLTNEQRLLLADVTSFLPKEHSVSLLAWLVCTTHGESWITSAEALGKWFLKDPQAVEVNGGTLRREDVVHKFEEQLSSYINFPRATQTFDEYLTKYSHLVSPGVVELYAFLRRLIGSGGPRP
jgi:hypothetical protein